MRVLSNSHPLLQADSPLNVVPRLWLEYVEPRLVRGAGEYPTCWLYLTQDGIAPDHGEPRIYINRKPVLLKHLIAEMYWHGVRCRGQNARHFVYHECGVINCLNPNHFLVNFEHPRWFDCGRYVTKKQNSLRRYKKELLQKSAAHALTAAGNEGDDT